MRLVKYKISSCICLTSMLALFALAFVGGVEKSYAQSLSGEFREVETLASKDTVFRLRRDGDYRFGIQAGGSGSYYMGVLKIPRIASDLKRGLIDVSSGDGAGYFLGGVAEFMPYAKTWGAALKVNFVDTRIGYGNSAPQNIDSSLKYVSQTKVNYISVSPEIRYNLPLDGLHLIVGLDFDFLTSSEGKVGRQFNNVGDITQLAIDTTFTPQSFRYGGHAGIGYDMFSANLPPHFRFRITPFITAQTGSNVASSPPGSSWNSFTMKAGLALKFSIDDVTDSIIPYDPNYVEPPRYLATAQYNRGIMFADNHNARNIEVLDLTISSIEIPNEETPNIQTIASEQAGQSEIPAHSGGETIAAIEIPNISNSESAKQGVNSAPVSSLKVEVNTVKPFSFSTSSSLNISAEARQYLDAVAEYLKSNPRSTVRLVGHSDNFGSGVEQQAVSERRAQQAVEYLLRKGVSRGRIFASAQGAREPIADNTSEQGRRRNRRIEVRVVQ